jgi:ABC-type polysaccharide/polyol phosphate transport system ATPase subunit
MSSDIVLKVNNIGKRYEIYEAPHHRLFQTLFRGRKQFYKEFWALRDISFEVKRGECVGIIGRNGSGKSTLLQVIAGTLAPTLGNVVLNGKVSALLELGSGFNPEFTGRENIYMNGSLLGLSKAQIDNKFDEIAAFADIGEFIEQPVKIYSSGMYIRLAFAVAISVDPEILIIDEALAVGDIRFQQKCFRRFKDFRDAGKPVLFVSHDMSSVKIFCDRAIWLEAGKVQSSGTADKVTKEFFSFMTYNLETETTAAKEEANRISSETPAQHREIQWETAADCQSFGEGGASITATVLYSKTRREPITIFEGGEDVIYHVKITANQPIESPIVGMIINDDHGVHILGYNSHNLGMSVKPFEPGETRVFCFEFKFPRLKVGTYLFSPAIAEGTQLQHAQLHWVHDAYRVQIASNQEIANIGCYVVPENASITENI